MYILILLAGDAREDTKLLLLNVIYFKGRWANPFPPSETAPGQFYVNGKTTVTADFMNLVATFKHTFEETLDAHVISLPYAVILQLHTNLK